MFHALCQNSVLLSCSKVCLQIICLILQFSSHSFIIQRVQTASEESKESLDLLNKIQCALHENSSIFRFYEHNHSMLIYFISHWQRGPHNWMFDVKTSLIKMCHAHISRENTRGSPPFETRSFVALRYDINLIKIWIWTIWI